MIKNNDNNVLKTISNESKDTIVDLDIVTPTIYNGIFSKFASFHEIELEEEVTLSEEILDEKISVFLNLQDQTSKNVCKLSNSTTKAINAIKTKDDTILNEVLKETEVLRLEIEKLKKSIYKDELTKTFNRKWLHDNLINEEAQSFINSGILSIVDLNYFKIVNDTYGHIIGDKVLIFVANELKKLQGKVIRYGGDEFVIIFNREHTKASVIKKLDFIRENILKKHMKLKEASFKISFSFGVQEFLKGDSLSSIVNYADKNMYNDKKQIKEKIKGISV